MASFLKLVNGRPKLVTEDSDVTIYDTVYVVSGTITAGSNVTLPSSGTYNSSELEVRLNGQRLESTYDYNYVSTPPRTQVTFTFDLVDGDRVRFRVDRQP